MKHTEETIRQSLNQLYLSNPKYLLHNLFLFGWESDYLAYTHSGYWHEVEIKVTMADFHNDRKKKPEKFRILDDNGSWRGRHTTDCPNYFSYAVPSSMAEKVLAETPSYIGVYSVGEKTTARCAPIFCLRPPTKLHSEKIDPDTLKFGEKMYYHYKHEEAFNIKSKQIVAKLRYEIQTIKAEFRAVTGFDFSESL